MLDLLSGFVTELRRSGLPVSLTEHLDAAEAVKHIPLEDREALKYALAATLVKSSSHWRAFETAFEVYFAVRTGGRGGAEGEDEGLEGEESEGEQASGQGGAQGQRRSWQSGGGGEGMTPEELAEMLFKSLLSADAGLMNMVARNAVDRYAGMEPGRPVGGTYYLYRTLRNLDLDAVLERLMAQAQAGAAGGSLTDLEERLAADEFKARASTSSAAPSRRRSAGAWSRTAGRRPWPAPCASRCPRTSTSCTPPARSWRRCTGCSSRCRASWRSGWPASAATAARARSTSGPRCGAPCRPVACRLSRASGIRGRPSPRSS